MTYVNATIHISCAYLVQGLCWKLPLQPEPVPLAVVAASAVSHLPIWLALHWLVVGPERVCSQPVTLAAQLVTLAARHVRLAAELG